MLSLLRTLSFVVYSEQPRSHFWWNGTKSSQTSDENVIPLRTVGSKVFMGCHQQLLIVLRIVLLLSLWKMDRFAFQTNCNILFHATEDVRLDLCIRHMKRSIAPFCICIPGSTYEISRFAKFLPNENSCTVITVMGQERISRIVLWKLLF